MIVEFSNYRNMTTEVPLNCAPFFIGISGESGVGKSTIANIISLYLGNENTLRLSTDDLHKWERTSPNWDRITHLNPAANNLELGDLHLIDLHDRKPIYRSVYNHSTGNFNPPIRLEAKKYIINEGLHAFFTEAMEKIINLKIFVDTDEELRTHWKLIRDTEQRGYKYNSVIEAINKRKIDGDSIRQKQISSADAIIKLGTASKIKSPGCKNEDIVLTVDFGYREEKTKMNPVFGFIQRFMVDLNDFLKISNVIGNNIELCQNNGGNVSVKVLDSIMIIKASGYEMKDIHGLNGHSVVDFKSVRNGLNKGSIRDDRSLTKAVNDAVTLKEYKRPSMETGFHSYLDKYVIHTHPVYLNAILCLERSREIVKELYSGLNYSYIEYANPGFDICKHIMGSDPHGIYFLENHGLIIALSDRMEAVGKTMEINDIAKTYLKNNNPDFKEFSLAFADMEMDRSFFYPDSAVFLEDDIIQKREILAAHNYIGKIGQPLGGLRILKQEDVFFLQNLESEIYRKSL